VVKREGERNNIREPTYQTSGAATAIVSVRYTLLRKERQQVGCCREHSQWQQFDIRCLVGALDTGDTAHSRGC
jgi:hypothetical protein